MGKKKKSRAVHPRQKINIDQMAAEIRKELRGILRRIDNLRCPLTPRLVESRPEGEPRYYLEKASTVEAIEEEVITLAGMVWHLKDRLNRWMSAAMLTSIPTVEEMANSEVLLQICGDLIDSKKHGGGTNRSGYAPQVGGFSFYPNGQIALRYDGALRMGEFFVETAKPIPFDIRIQTGDGSGHFGSAVDLITKAFDIWKRLIEKTDLLAGDNPENTELRRLLQRFEKGEYPIFKSLLAASW